MIGIDFDFCRRHHGFESDEAVRNWFATPNPLDLRTFSPAFSPLDYLMSNPDLQEARFNPVFHYLTHGASERRKIKPAPMLRRFRGSEMATRSQPAAGVRVAIVLHIFYPSFIPYFAKFMELIDLHDWDVFISCPQHVLDSHGDEVRQALGSRLRVMRAVPNRGRNFAPLLVDFAAELADYDAICHCHSKQSLHSGRQQTEWADYLISALIGTPDVVRRHVNLITSDACDLIAPAPFPGIPAWASHSLSNDADFRRLCQQLDLDGETGFMTYPVGGMFWISRAAYARLVSLHLSHEDFPPEPSHDDGEVHHALERVTGRIAGKKMAFYDQVTGVYWAPDAVLRAEVGRFPKVEELCEAINQSDFITFDFFDTLGIRSTGDEEWAKKRVEFALGQNYVSRRNMIERKLRAHLGATGDVPLPAIADALAGEGFVDAARAVALERALDLATLMPRPEVVFAYEYAIREGKDVRIVSDSYYDQGVIAAFFRKHDISMPTDILMSADLGFRKDRGDLWDHVAAIRGGRMALHIGDNVHSDIQKAAQRGFQTFYVPHWRHELLPFSGFSKTLNNRNLTNPAFARSIDRAPLEQFDDELPKRNLDPGAERLRKRRRAAKDRTAR